MRARLVLLVFILALAVPALAHGNPFTGGSGHAPAPEREAAPEGASGESGVRQEQARNPSLFGRVLAWQRWMKRELAATLRGWAEEGSAGALALLLGLSFAYGVVHAAGPGHGKGVAASYVVARHVRPLPAAAFGLLMGGMHAASAVALVFGAVLMAGGMAGGGLGSLMDGFGPTLERFSYGAVAAIGLVLTVGAARELVRPHQDEAPRGLNRKGMVAVALLAGLVPCPGASLVCIFALTLGLPLTGLAAAGAMALGMGATIALAAVTAACCRGAVLGLSGRGRRVGVAFYKTAALAGALVVLALGATLFAGTF